MLRLLVVVVGSVVLGARGSAPTWPQLLHGSARDGHAPGVDGTDSCVLHWNASFAFPSSASVSMTPVVDGSGDVYIATGLGEMYKFEGATGKQLWKYSSNSTGVRTWGPDVALSPSGDRVYFTFLDRLTCLDTTKGRRVWQWDVPGTSNNHFHTLTMSSSGVLFTNTLEHVFAVDPSDGSQKWSVPFASSWRGSAIAPTSGSPVLFGSTGCNGASESHNCTVVGFDQTTGKIVSNTSALGTTGDKFDPPLSVDASGLLYLIRQAGSGLKTLDAVRLNGNVAWTFQCPAALEVLGIVLSEAHVYVGCSGGTVHQLDQSHGKEQWSVSGLYGAKVVALVGDSTLIYTGYGHFGAVDTETKAKAWNCSAEGDGTQYYLSMGPGGTMFVPFYRGSQLITLYGAGGHVVWRTSKRTLAIVLATVGAVLLVAFVTFATYLYRKRRRGAYQAIQ